MSVDEESLKQAAGTDHGTPWLVAGEKETLVAFLDYLRESIIRKASGIDQTEARRPLVPSGTSLLGLVKHLAWVEQSWFQLGFAGEKVARLDPELVEADTREMVVKAYRDAIERSNEIVDDCDDLDLKMATPRRDGNRFSMRWILVHMVEETARHAGHADIIREQLDGSVGR
jgi:uncharacterized damage-inducible protein DinB